MWLIQFVFSELVLLIVRNVVFGIPVLDIFNSSNESARVNFVLYGSILIQLITTYLTLYLWARIALSRNLVSRDWLEDALGKDICKYLGLS